MFKDKSFLSQFPLPDRYKDHEDYFFYNDSQGEVYDAHEMFRFFDGYFFDNLLVASQVKWSSRMTLCAGTCKMDIPGSCTITLSKPLLQFRSNNELKETLIHEMIHAYLFITNPRACMDRGGHGKEFTDIMDNINSITGLNITVYHSFHDEVDFFRKHIWKCDGPCQSNPPFFGLVKRAMNRPPGPKDPWFSRHQATCGGTFTKIDGPEFKEDGKEKEAEKKRAIKKKRSEDSQNTLTNYFKKSKTCSSFEDEDESIPRVYLYMINPKEKTPISQKKNDEAITIHGTASETKGFSKEEFEFESLHEDLETNSFFDVKKENTFGKKNSSEEITKPSQNANFKDFIKNIVEKDKPQTQAGNLKDLKILKKGSSSDIEKILEKNGISKDLLAPKNAENAEIGFVSASKIYTPTKLKTEVDLTKENLYFVLIRRERDPYLKNFWVRVAVNSEYNFKRFLDIIPLLSDDIFSEERLFLKQGDPISNLDISLKNLNLQPNCNIFDDFNNITIKLEKIFSFDENSSNVKLLQSRFRPVCLSASFFGPNQEIVSDNRSRLENLDKILSCQF